MILHFSRKAFVVMLGALFVGVSALGASATHWWGWSGIEGEYGYHWARKANPFTLKLGDNVSSTWDGYLATAASDWSTAIDFDTVVATGKTNPKSCRPVSGRAEVCSTKYGPTNWLGIASVWASGKHIVQGTVKMNDTYFNTPTYNTSAWRNLVMCQETGHILGLDHQDEDFSNTPLGTCMDYSNDPTLNQHPNAHDYEMLEYMYEHLDTTTTVGQTRTQGAMPDIDHSDPGAWGREVRTSGDGRVSLYELNLGNDDKVFTFVFWADGGRSE